MTTPEAASPLPLKGAPPAAGLSPIRGGLPVKSASFNDPIDQLF
jgi:hypothetical protein